MGVVLSLPWLGATNDVRRRALPGRVNETDLPGVGDGGPLPGGPEFLGTQGCQLSRPGVQQGLMNLLCVVDTTCWLPKFILPFVPNHRLVASRVVSQPETPSPSLPCG